MAGLAIYPDTTFAIARIRRDRKTAADKYLEDRDTRALEQTMARLDAEEAEAKASTRVVEPSEALAWLRDLPALWEAADDSGRRLLTEALFEKVEVLGVQSVTIHPTPEADAHGWSEAFGDAPLIVRVGDRIATDGRGERSQPDTMRTSCSVTTKVLVSLAESPPSEQVTVAVDVPGPVLPPIFHVHETVPDESATGWVCNPAAVDTVPEA